MQEIICSKTITKADCEFRVASYPIGDYGTISAFACQLQFQLLNKYGVFSMLNGHCHVSITFDMSKHRQSKIFFDLFDAYIKHEYCEPVQCDITGNTVGEWYITFYFQPVDCSSEIE